MHRRRTRLAVGGTLAALALGTGVGPAAAAASPAITTIASTVPANGDVNPYGVALVPRSVGALHRGDVLVSNFNDAANAQGTGTTIVQVTPSGRVSTFAQIDPRHLPGRCPGGVGLTTALSVLRSGWVIVGSLPTMDGSSATAKAGCLLVLDSGGTVRETITDKDINGPWDMTAADHGDRADLFVTNVLNGTVAADGKIVRRGTVLRIPPRTTAASTSSTTPTTRSSCCSRAGARRRPLRPQPSTGRRCGTSSRVLTHSLSHPYPQRSIVTAASLHKALR